MKHTLDILDAKLNELKSQQFGWVVALPEKDGSDRVRTVEIIADLAVQITSLEHDINLIKSCRSLNAKHVKRMVDEYYKEHYNLDENDNFVEKDKS